MRLTTTTTTRNAVRLLRRHASTSAADDFDVVIVGGGPVGLALASALASSPLVRQNLRVALVEASDLDKVRNWSPEQGTFSNRASSLTHRSQTFLKGIRAWEHVDQQRTCPIENMQVWDGVSDARIHFPASLLGLGAPGQGMARMTENLNLQRGLLRHLRTISEVYLLDKTKVQSIARGENAGWPLVQLDNGRVLRSRLFGRRGWFQLSPIVATMFHHPRGAFLGPHTTAYQRFLPTGPIAFLPLSPTASSLVWSTKPELAKALIASGPDTLQAMINAAFRLPNVSMEYLNKLILESPSPLSPSEIQAEITWRERSHGIDATSAFASAQQQRGVPPADAELLPPHVASIQLGSVASFPLRFNHTDSYLGEGEGARTVLVGDAAHTVHPLAGQGLNLGLGDVEVLACCIETALLDGGDVGSRALLPYASERYFANHKVMSVMDKLHKVYSTTLDPVVWARSVGVEVINELDSVKTALMMEGSGKAYGQGNFVWEAAAKGVEVVGSSAGMAKAVAEAAPGVLGWIARAVGNTVNSKRS
ncbi:Ubiquinone biosynthesis monooxygenase COQ6, mitochondrial [Mycena kentingensis (nom. inval.)]|nr:Ubiquinone biosynthesis monooxygenase COQ6, mitochondrial [Mycena kentingensis (nom. inval.)]